jgi:hypothetical protein
LLKGLSKDLVIVKRVVERAVKKHVFSRKSTKTYRKKTTNEMLGFEFTKRPASARKTSGQRRLRLGLHRGIGAAKDSPSALMNYKQSMEHAGACGHEKTGDLPTGAAITKWAAGNLVRWFSWSASPPQVPSIDRCIDPNEKTIGQQHSCSTLTQTRSESDCRIVRPMRANLRELHDTMKSDSDTKCEV